MAKPNIFDVIMKTIGDVQQKNAANPNEPTADPSIFDILKEKLLDLDSKSRENRTNRGKSPISILDRIKKEIEGTRRLNKKDPNVETAPPSVFENLLKKIEQRPQRTANSGIRKIVEDYNLDVSKLPQDVIQQVQQKYMQDRKAFDKQYAQAIYDLARKYNKR
jgi:hypothetical protein